jgi:DNA-binding SARP family transcriptional activator
VVGSGDNLRTRRRPASAGETYRRQATTKPLHVSLTGEVSVKVAGVLAGCRALRSLQARMVLAMLVLERPRPVSRQELSALLWDGTPPSSWESVLRTAVARVRAALADAGLDSHATVQSVLGCYQLRLPEGTVVDLEKAAADVEHALTALAAVRVADEIPRLEEADRITRRPFLPEADGEWVRERRTRQRALRLRVLEALATARLAAKQPAEAVPAAREAIALEPFRESSHRLLMSALTGSGNRAQALVAYEQCRALLGEELGVDPSPETEALFIELLHAEPASARPARSGGRPLDEPGLPARLRVESGRLLVGRVRELELIRRRITRPRRGPPSILLVDGEIGMGKTVLVAHAAENARADGALVLYGHCDEKVMLAYAPLAEALTQLAAHLPAELVTDHLATYGTGLLRLVPELRQRASATVPAESGPGVDPQTERYLLFRAAAALLASASADRTVLLIVDDLHWADRPSLQLLRYLTAATDSSRLVLLLTCRGTGLAASSDAGNTIHELLRQPEAERLVLTGLTEHDLAPLVEEAAGQRLGSCALAWARAVRCESGGNPFLAHELLRHLAERFSSGPSAGWPLVPTPVLFGLPRTIHDVVARQVEPLGARTADVLRQAAVLGSKFDLTTLAQLVRAGEDEVLDDLDRAVAAGILVELPADVEAFAFRNALVQLALYEQIGLTRRRRWCRRMAQARL